MQQWLTVYAKFSRVRVVASSLVNVQETAKTEVAHGGMVARLEVDGDGIDNPLDFAVAVAALGQQEANHQQVAGGNSFPDSLGGVVVDEVNLGFVSLAANSVLRALAVFSTPMEVSLKVTGEMSLTTCTGTAANYCRYRIRCITCSKPQVEPL